MDIVQFLCNIFVLFFSERTSHITQIAAVHSTGQFSTYVMPEKKMSLKASEITGVTVVGESMLVKGQTVTAVTIKSALTSFMTFLKKCSPVILVGHNMNLSIVKCCSMLSIIVEKC